jgi:hypothetical protein
VDIAPNSQWLFRLVGNDAHQPNQPLEKTDIKIMVNNRQQEHFWEVALANDRDAFIRGKRAEYVRRGGQRPVRLDRSHKTSLVADFSHGAKQRQSRLDRLAGR